MKTVPIRPSHRFFILVKNEATNQLTEVAIDQSSGGYPYVGQINLLPALLSEATAQGLMGKFKPPFTFAEMSNGALNLPYLVRAAANINKGHPRARFTVSLYELIQGAPDFKTELLEEVTLEVSDGLDHKSRDKTQITLHAGPIITGELITHHPAAQEQ